MNELPSQKRKTEDCRSHQKSDPWITAHRVFSKVQLINIRIKDIRYQIHFQHHAADHRCATPNPRDFASQIIHRKKKKNCHHYDQKITVVRTVP